MIQRRKMSYKNTVRKLTNTEAMKEVMLRKTNNFNDRMEVTHRIICFT